VWSAKGKVALRSYTNLLNRINPSPSRNLLLSVPHTAQISATFIDEARSPLAAINLQMRSSVNRFSSEERIYRIARNRVKRLLTMLYTEKEKKKKKKKRERRTERKEEPSARVQTRTRVTRDLLLFSLLASPSTRDTLSSDFLFYFRNKSKEKACR